MRKTILDLMIERAEIMAYRASPQEHNMLRFWIGNLFPPIGGDSFELWEWQNQWLLAD